MISSHEHFYSESMKSSHNQKSANSIYILTNQEGIQAYYLPSYMRLHIQSFCDLDLQSLTAQMQASLHFTFFYGPLPEHIVKQIISKMVLFFSKDNIVNLNQENKEVIVKIDSNNHMVNARFRNLFHLRINSNIFLSPFELLNLMLSVQIKSVNIDWPENKPSKVKINFNLMDVNPELKNMKISFSDGIQFGNYNLAENYRSVEYTNQKHPKIVRQELKLQNTKKHHFKYAHFTIPLYKKPFSTLTTIFLPIILLAVINLGTFFQDYILHDRIGNIANVLVAFVALIPTIRQQMPPSPTIALIEIIVYIQVLTTCLCLVQSLIVRNMDQAVDPILWQQYLLFYLALAIAILGLIPVVILSIMHIFYWEDKYNSLTSSENKLAFSPQYWNNYDDDRQYQLQTKSSNSQRHYFWNWLQKYEKQRKIKQVIPVFTSKDYTRTTLSLKMATLNFSTILMSPFQFYNLDESYYLEVELGRQFMKNIKQDESLQKIQGGKQSLERKIENKQFQWGISKVDKKYQKERYCPLYNAQVGIEYHKLISKEVFQQKWNQKWNSIENNKQNNQTTIQRIRTFDWLCYKTFVEIFCHKIINRFQQIFQENRNYECLKLYKKYMKEFFEKQYLNEDKKYRMLVESLKNHQIDILFLQQVRNSIKKYIPTEKYQVILPIRGQQGCAIIVNKQFVTEIKTYQQVTKELKKLNIFQDDQFKDAAVTIVNNLFLISCHFRASSKTQKQTQKKTQKEKKIQKEKKKTTLLKYLHTISESHSFVVGVNSGCDFICSSQGKLQQAIDLKGYVFPQSDGQPTSKKIRTSLQTQLEKAQRVIEQRSDYLLSTYKLLNTTTVTVKGEISQNVLSLPFNQHPYDHFMVQANVDAPNMFELVRKSFIKAKGEFALKQLVQKLV